MPEYRVEWRQRPLRRSDRMIQRVTFVKARTVRDARAEAIRRIESYRGLAESELIIHLTGIKRLPDGPRG